MTRDVVFCWLRSDKHDESPVRVEISRKYIDDYWHLNWIDRRAIEAEFHKKKVDYADAAANVLAPEGIKYRMFKVFDGM
jgi:hypothetical protein